LPSPTRLTPIEYNKKLKNETNTSLSNHELL